MYHASFRSPINEVVNKGLVQNMKALDGMDKISEVLIESKCTVYYTIKHDVN